MVVFTLDTHFGDYMDTMEGKKLPVVPLCQRERRAGNWYRSSGSSGNRFGLPLEAGSGWCAAVGRYDFVELVGCARISASPANAMLIKAAVLTHPYRWTGLYCAGA